MLMPGLTLLTILFYSILRGLFLFWNWSLYQTFSQAQLTQTFLYGLRFDLSAVAMLALPAMLIQGLGWVLRQDWRRAATGVFLLTNVPFLILNIVDTELVQNTGRRFSVSSLVLIEGAMGQVYGTVLSYMNLFGVGFVIVASYLLVAWIWMKIKVGPKQPGWGLKPLISSVVFLALVIIAARGGLQKKPIGFAYTQIFATPVLNHLAMNSSFSFLQTLKRTPLPREHVMSNEEMLSLMNGSTPGESVLAGRDLGLTGQQNVVVIILESFSLEQMGKIHGDKGFTPFLDELAEKSLFFPNGFANARRSIEGVPAVLAGIPTLMSEPFISSQFGTDTYYGLGTLLGAEGYTTSFFHGGENGTMYFDQFARGAGLKRYYGLNEYPNKADFDGIWGIWDEPFLLNMVQELNKEKQPFLASVFTLSSHTPFKVPAKDAGTYPKGPSEVSEVVGYSDHALREFFESASHQAWFNHTLFVLTADHTFKPSRPQYQNALGDYRVPILFYHPQIKKWPIVDLTQPVQQIDILPSILDFVHSPPHLENLMGRSVFRTGPRYVVMASEGTDWLVTKDNLLTRDGKGRVTVETLAPHLRNVPEFKPVIADPNSDLQKDLLQKLQATRQYFTDGLWDNHLYFAPNR